MRDKSQESKEQDKEPQLTSQRIQIEATRALKNLSKTDDVVHMLMKESALQTIMLQRYSNMDTQSQEHILETVSAACALDSKYRNQIAKDEEVREILYGEIKAKSSAVALIALKILRQLAKDQENLDTLQGDALRLSNELIQAYQHFEYVLRQSEPQPESTSGPAVSNTQQIEEVVAQEQEIGAQESMPVVDQSVSDLIFREISKILEYILKFHEFSSSKAQKLTHIGSIGGQQMTAFETENNVIKCVVQLGRSTQDLKTQLNSATSLAHITEVLDCNPQVASDQALEFMIDMLKDMKNIKNHRQGCRYFANLSFHQYFAKKLIDNGIVQFLLKAIDGNLDEDTIKHSAIAIANLSSHPDFMAHSENRVRVPGALDFGKTTNDQQDRTEKWMIKPLIHLLDSAHEQKLNLIQSACITLCNMASKPSLHKHFIHEPEITSIKNCFLGPSDKSFTSELIWFMIKLVCNLTKNPETLPILYDNGFLGIFFNLLNQKKDKEIYGNVVTAIAYFSVHPEARAEIVQAKVMAKILRTSGAHVIDKKLTIIALTTMLNNGKELQEEFISSGGLDTMLRFLSEKDKIFQQLACKCFSTLSESQENLDRMIKSEILNKVVINCLKNRDVDVETLKEITKIFINMILWRKIQDDQIESTCFLCDIGLMVEDLDMNVLAMFCLNALSENDKNHVIIRISGFGLGKIKMVATPVNSANRALPGPHTLGSSGQRLGESTHSNAQSIFSRINHLLDYNQRVFQSMQTTNQGRDPRNAETSKRELLVTLITSFYLNLARNKENQEILLKLELFRRLNDLLSSQQQGQNVSQALCYTNIIFAKLLRFRESRDNCIHENGHKLLIQILKQPSTNKHLFLETLDSIKLFLARRKDLREFSEITEHCVFDDDCLELNVSYLQVLAILSFEKRNHESLKRPSLLQQMEDKQMFQQIFTAFKDVFVEELQERKMTIMKKSTRLLVSNEISPYQSKPNDTDRDSISGQSIGSQGLVKRMTMVKKKNGSKQTKHTEMALSIAIILSNLSNDEEYIKTLLGVDDCGPQEPSMRDIKSIEEAKGLPSSSISHVEEETNLALDDSSLLKKPEILRMVNIFDLLSNEDPFISEQISILIANVSNSPHFRSHFISDRCIKSIMKILKHQSVSSSTEVSLLAILIVILNLSAEEKMISGVENMKFLSSLQEIIKNDTKPLENRSIGLMAISNIFTLTSQSDVIKEDTKDFALEVLRTWHLKLDGSDQVSFDKQNRPNYVLQIRDLLEHAGNRDVIKNLVYASLILFYNILLKDHKEGINHPAEREMIIKLIDILDNTVMDFFEDSIIVNVVLQLITLFTCKSYHPNLFDHPKILKYVFSRLKQQEHNLVEFETLRLSALAMSRLTSRFDTTKVNTELYLKEVEEFDNCEFIMSYLTEISGELQTEAYSQANRQSARQTLQYMLNALENITAEKTTRELLNCRQLFKHTIDPSLIRNLELDNKISLIRIMFNLNFFLEEPEILSKEFLTLLHEAYKGIEQNDSNILKSETDGELSLPSKQNFAGYKLKRKIISIVVVASAIEANHHAIIDSNFYTQFKKNINTEYKEAQEANQEIELFGLVNIALNWKKIYKIYHDLKKIHRLAVKSDKIDFKTKVDLITEVSKFIASYEAQKASGVVNSGRIKEDQIGDEGVVLGEEDSSVVVKECLKALIFTLVRLTALLPMDNFAMFKYFLTAILDCTKNLKDHLKYIIRIGKIIDFLKSVLDEDSEISTQYQFKIVSHNSDGQFDPVMLRFTLKMIVCDIFFNLKFEKDFFKVEQVEDAIKLLIDFSRQVMVKNLERKHALVSNTLRLVSQMIATIHHEPDSAQKIKRTGAFDFVKEALQLSKDFQPCINIDALFCLNNLMNIKEIAEDPVFVEDSQVLYNAFVIYFAYNEQIQLDECLITFLYSISKYRAYQLCLKDKNKMLFSIMRKHIKPDPKLSQATFSSCRQKLFSMFHNLTENQEVCKELAIKDFLKYTNEMFRNNAEQEGPMNSNTNELAIKSLINICQHSNEAFDKETYELRELLNNISRLYHTFENLAKQYSLRLVTILTRQWKEEQLDKYLIQIVSILSEFIKNCSSNIEMKLVQFNLDKIGSFKTQMKLLSQHLHDERCKNLIKHIAMFLKDHQHNPEFAQECIQLLKFSKKLSKQSAAHSFLIEANIHEIAMQFINSRDRSKPFVAMEEVELKQQLATIQNVMKMVKYLFESQNIQQQKRNEIIETVKQHEGIIAEANAVLIKLSETENTQEDIPVIIVNIIMCYNSISNQLELEQVKGWIQDFSKRLVDHQKQNRAMSVKSSWYLEKYVFIIELLVTKNLERVDEPMTRQLLKIYEQRGSVYSKTIWYKFLKILAHLHSLQNILDQPQDIERIFDFILQAYENTNEENLSFLYFMKVVMLLTKQVPCEEVYTQTTNFSTILDKIYVFFAKNYQDRDEPLVKEIILYVVDYFKLLMLHERLHEFLISRKIVDTLISMLEIHNDIYLVKSISSTLCSQSTNALFYPSLLSDKNLQIILQKIIHFNVVKTEKNDQAKLQDETLSNLVSCIENVMIRQTQAPIKYLLSSAILQMTEDPSIKLNDLTEVSCESTRALIEILDATILSLEDTESAPRLTNGQLTAKGDNQGVLKHELAENFLEFKHNAIKFCLLALTNIFLKTNGRQIFELNSRNRSRRVHQVIMVYSSYENDPQMNLRFLSLIEGALQDQRALQRLETMDIELSSLITFIIDNNICKFRNILESQDSYYIYIPDIWQPEASLAGEKQSQEENTLLGQPSFLFEACSEETPILKIDTIKMSLCLSMKILAQLVKIKKGCARREIFSRIDKLFMFLVPFIKFNDGQSLDYVLMVIKIIQSCADERELQRNLVEKFDCVQMLINVAQKALDEQKELPEDTEGQRQSIILSVLETFYHMSHQKEDVQGFEWHLSKHHNTKQLINKLTTYKTPDGKIAQLSQQLAEALSKEFPEGDEIDLQIEINGLISKSSETREQNLAEIHQRIMSNQQKLDFVYSFELAELVLMLKEDTHQRPEDILDSKTAKMRAEQMEEVDKNIKLYCLRILQFVYHNKWLNQSKSQAALGYKEKLPALKELVDRDAEKNQKEMFNQSRTKASHGPKVGCVLEMAETFDILYRLVIDTNHTGVLFEPVVDIILLYSQSGYKLPQSCLEHVIPIFTMILTRYIEGETADDIDTVNSNLIQKVLTKMIESIIHFLAKIEDKDKILAAPESLCDLLCRLIRYERVYKDQRSLLMNFEHLTKQIFYSTVKLPGKAVELIKFLLKGGTKAQTLQYKKLGVFCLQCVALSLKEQPKICNLEVFSDDEILQKLMVFAIDKKNIEQGSMLTKQLRAQAEEIGQQEQLQELKNIRILALQILVLVSEFQNQISLRGKPEEHMNNELLEQPHGKLVKRIFFKEAKGLLSLLIQRSLDARSDVFTQDEIQIVARAFACVSMPDFLALNMSIFSQSELLPEESKQNFGSQKKDFEITLSSYFRALANIIKKYDDPKIHYSAFYSLLNFLYAVPMQKTESQIFLRGQKQDHLLSSLLKQRVDQLDYSTLTVCLVKSDLLKLILDMPHQQAEEDLMRIKMKLAITILFKAHKKRELIGERLEMTKEQAAHTKILYEKLGVKFDAQRKETHDMIRIFVDRIHAFELQNIHKDGYVQFIHMVSQLVAQSTTPVDKPEHRSAIVPTSGIMAGLIKSFAQSMDPSHIDSVMNAIKGVNFNGQDQALKGRKVLLYKLFYFNYIFQVSGKGVMDNLLAAEPSLHEKFAEDLASDSENEASEKNTNADALSQLLSSLMVIVDLLQSRRVNNMMDQAIKPFKTRLTQEKAQNQDLNQIKRPDEQEFQKNEAGAQENVQVQENSELDAAERQRQMVEQHRVEDEQMSTSLSIVRMTLQNIDLILDSIMQTPSSPIIKKIRFFFTDGHLDACLKLLSDFEGNGSIVQSVYSILEKFIKLESISPGIKSIFIVEKSQPLMKQAVKHASSFKCHESFNFLQTLICISEKFKNKEEMSAALTKIRPNLSHSEDQLAMQ